MTNRSGQNDNEAVTGTTSEAFARWMHHTTDEMSDVNAPWQRWFVICLLYSKWCLKWSCQRTWSRRPVDRGCTSDWKRSRSSSPSVRRLWHSTSRRSDWRSRAFTSCRRSTCLTYCRPAPTRQLYVLRAIPCLLLGWCLQKTDVKIQITEVYKDSICVCKVTTKNRFATVMSKAILHCALLGSHTVSVRALCNDRRVCRLSVCPRHISKTKRYWRGISSPL